MKHALIYFFIILLLSVSILNASTDHNSGTVNNFEFSLESIRKSKDKIIPPIKKKLSKIVKSVDSFFKKTLKKESGCNHADCATNELPDTSRFNITETGNYCQELTTNVRGFAFFDTRKDKLRNNTNLSPIGADEYCQQSPRYFLKKLCTRSSTLGVGNEGSLLGPANGKTLFGLNTGVCWWHSKFQRNANYLTYFSPEKKKPSKLETMDIFKKILKGKEVVEVPGYSSIFEFVTSLKPSQMNQKSTADLQNLLHRPNNNIKALVRSFEKDMQKSTFLKQEWIKGLEGRSNRGWNKVMTEKQKKRQKRKQLKEVKEMMIALDHNKKSPKIQYAMLQYPGVKAHSMLIYDIKEIKNDNGKVIAYKTLNHDSNKQVNKHSTHKQYVYDIELGMWFSLSNYSKLLKKRLKGDQFTTFAYPTTYAAKDEYYAQANAPDNIKSEIWTLKIQNNHHLRKINRAFKKRCGQDLF